jgi:hypothetical protein
MNWVVECGVVEIPAQVDFERAVFVEPVNTCWKAIRKARIEPGETVVVLGQGPIGLVLMMLARHVGASVLTTDPLPSRRQKAFSWALRTPGVRRTRICRLGWPRGRKAWVRMPCRWLRHSGLCCSRRWTSLAQAAGFCCLRITIR